MRNIVAATLGQAKTVADQAEDRSDFTDSDFGGNKRKRFRRIQRRVTSSDSEGSDTDDAPLISGLKIAGTGQPNKFKRIKVTSQSPGMF